MRNKDDQDFELHGLLRDHRSIAIPSVKGMGPVSTYGARAVRRVKHTKDNDSELAVLETLDLAECNETLENKLEALVLKKSDLTNSRTRSSKSKLRQDQQSKTNQEVIYEVD